MRRAAMLLVVLALVNGPVALYVLGSHLGLSQPDSIHTFALSYRGGTTVFYTPLVGEYLIFSGIGSCFALGLFMFVRLLAKRAA